MYFEFRALLVFYSCDYFLLLLVHVDINVRKKLFITAVWIIICCHCLHIKCIVVYAVCEWQQCELDTAREMSFWQQNLKALSFFGIRERFAKACKWKNTFLYTWKHQILRSARIIQGWEWGVTSVENLNLKGCLNLGQNMTSSKIIAFRGSCRH